jgi:phosphopantothenoylcysteine decarboxylase / phosphopantothenate---cysteine ligase
MANLTIRKLDDAIRDELRLRAARNGRSVEDEVRVILREAAQNQVPAVSVGAACPLEASIRLPRRKPPPACRASP